MAQTRRVPVFGSRPPCAYQSRLDEHAQTIHKGRLELAIELDISEEFIYNGNYDDEDQGRMSLFTVLNSSYNIVDYIRNREYGMKEYRSINLYHGLRHILTQNMFKENCIPLKSLNKVFCSQWLCNKQILFGTKCNKLMVFNVKSGKLDHITSIKGRDDAKNQLSGIHSLKFNPSRSLLATGAYNANEIAVYRLPTLDPVALAQGVHKDLVFDIDWLDDEFFVSGSRDTKLALWQVKNQYEEQHDDKDDPMQLATQFLSPKKVKMCKTALKVRAISFNKDAKDMATLSLNGCVHIWDVERFQQKLSIKLRSLQDVACMELKKNDSSLYGIGCRSYTILIDARTLQTINKIPSRYSGCAIRSLSFQENLITIGTGVGIVMFYDIRAGKYLESSMNSRAVVLKTSRGYDYPNEDFLMDQNFQQVKYSPAIYTHCYDYSGTRLFTGGGPLPVNLCGNYGAIWNS